MGFLPRPLSYPLKAPNEIRGFIGDDDIVYFVPDLFPLDPDEKITIGLNLSLNEFVELASAIDVGRDIAYNDTSLNIWFLWVQALREGGSMVTCEDIATCLNDPVVFNVLINNEEFVTNLVENNTFTNTLVQNSNIFNTWNVVETTGQERLPEYQEPMREAPQDCDLDKLWAGIREIVKRIDDNGRDLLQDLTTLNDKAERIQGVIDLVPIVGDTIADVSDFFTETIPDILNAYDAYSSEAVIDQIACDLFSMVCGECRYPTYEEVFNYYKSFGEPSIPSFATASYLILWNATKALTATPQPAYFTTNAWQIYTLGFDGLWNGSYGKKSFGIWASLGEDLPNDNWIVLCDDCLPVELCAVYEFTEGLHGFTPETNIWVPGQGLRSENSVGGRFNFYVQAYTYDIERIEVDYYIDGGLGSFRDIDVITYVNGVQGAQLLTTPQVANQEATASWNSGANGVNGLRIFMRNSGGGGIMYCRRIRIYYMPVTGSPQNSSPC